MNEWIIISGIVTAGATVVIAIYAWKSHNLAKENHELASQIQKSTEQREGEFKDLFQAITVATLLSGPTSTGGMERVIKTFGQYYKGETRIFD